MKKRIIITLIIIVMVCIIVYLEFFSTIGIITNNDDESMICFSAYYRTVAAVADSGNVYVKGRITSDYNFGISHVREYNHLLSEQFVCIYDKNDAVLVCLDESGGCIITNQSDVYVFINGSNDFKVPTYFCSGYIKACVAGENIYLLSNDGIFGYVDIYSPEDFHVIGTGVVNFDIEYSKADDKYQYSVIFVLTENHRLYVLNEGETIADNNCFIDEIIDFDTTAFVCDLPKDRTLRKYIEVSLLNIDYQAYWYEGYLDEDYSKIANMGNYILAGSEINQVVSYKRGIAMLNKLGKVSLFGYDYTVGIEKIFSGETVFEGVNNLFSGEENLIVLYTNGNIEYYGFDSSQETYKSISH